MEDRILGNTGMKVSRIGIGLYEMGVSQQDDAVSRSEALLNLALDLGITLLDTAGCYGRSEEMIGAAVSHRREEFILATKTGHVTHEPYTPEPDEEAWSRKTIGMSIDRSLVRLRTDYLDLVQLHSPSLEILEQSDAVSALVKAKEEGKTRFIGYSGDNDDAARAIELGVFDTLQTSFNVVDQSARNYLDKAVDADLGIIIKRPIANMSWVGGNSDYPSPSEYLDRARAMMEAGPLPDDPGDPVHLALGFLLSHKQVDTAIIGTTNPHHLRSNIEFVQEGVEPSSELVSELYSRFDRLGEGWFGQG